MRGGRTMFSSLRIRVAGGFAGLLALFLLLIVGQFVVGDRLRIEHIKNTERVDALSDTNQSVLQEMTNAETAVRGFQLTGDNSFLQPYEGGRATAFDALDRLAAGVDDPEVNRLVQSQRDAAESWLYAYAIPIVNAGQADSDPARLVRGKELFDDVRTANSDVSAAIDAYGDALARDERGDSRTAGLLFGALAVLVVLAGMGLALLHQRHLLAPLEDIRVTLRRLADGDLNARARPVGPGELRAVAGTVNDLAAETERLITAERARAARSELRQAVAAELRSDGDPKEIGWRMAMLVGNAMGADAVYGRVTIQPGERFEVHWPPNAATLDPMVSEELKNTPAGQAITPATLPGGLAVAMSGDTGCPPGMVCVVRPGRPEWTPEERRLLAALSREIDHNVHQFRLQLRQARLISELRVLDEQKDVFVSTVTHELRTPLTSILGYTEMLVEDEDDSFTPIQKRGLDAILRNANRLQETVTDLLLLDRSNERVGAEAVPVDVAAVVDGLYESLGTAARAKDLRWDVSTEPAWVIGDATQLERALRNLLENSIKFTDQGGRLECRVATANEQVVIEISDTGIGIPADDLPGLFTPFHRASNAMHQAVQGSGLGLAIVRNIVSEHGGTVTARSDLDQGSTFTIKLPLSQPLAEPTRSGHA
ncbi:ATP-binding protein [Actinoplanes sp. NPDC049596]|uniref:ATP-binding protein n=1 Tax=unclassified Actinoplanes TaxID=2626549 RepID=UPI00343A8564